MEEDDLTVQALMAWKKSVVIQRQMNMRTEITWSTRA
jgi:hypothetical protein